MAMKNGCNKGMAEKSGKNSTRVDPAKLGRANMAKGGVNQSLTQGKIARPPMAKK